MFTRPTTFDDLAVLLERIKTFPWSGPVLSDATMTAERVSLELRIGNTLYRKEWVIR